jgi:hypothetical protein
MHHVIMHHVNCMLFAGCNASSLQSSIVQDCTLEPLFDLLTVLILALAAA